MVGPLVLNIVGNLIDYWRKPKENDNFIVKLTNPQLSQF